MRTSVWWAWHSWGWTLFKWWNLVLILYHGRSYWPPFPGQHLLWRSYKFALYRPQHCFQCCFHLPNMREEACWGHYASNKWSVWGILNNCLCSQMVEHNYCSPIMICKTLTNTTFCNNHFKFNNCFIISLELAVTKCGVCKCIAPGALSLISE